MKHFTIITALVLIMLGVLASYFFGFGRAPEKKKSRLLIREVAFDVEIADTIAARVRGLSGRASLETQEGMLFIFEEPGSYGIWMKDMRFPIDIVWIHGDAIAGFSENVSPQPGVSVFALEVYLPPRAVDRVLELPAGSVGKYQFAVGDRVSFSRQ